LFKVPFMDQKAVSGLEEDLESSILNVIMKAVKGRRIPMLPSHRTIHLMAKAAVVVYETAVEVSEAEARDAATPREGQ
jgi:tRNA(Leu) C34 or U34 (ribose-2'-O)-methylase TrmL